MNGDAEKSPPPTSSLRLARALLAREPTPGGDGSPETAAALQRVLVRVSQNLRDTMGEDGCTALFARALARTEAKHPVLTRIRRTSDGGIQLDAVVAGVEAHGVPAVTAGIEALLAALIDVLGRLIGEDMTVRIIEHDGPEAPTGGGAQPQ
jgi:hypothetical protein